MFKIVLDTNIIVSAIHKNTGIPGIILSLVLSEDFQVALLCISDAIFKEYQEVLARNKFNYFNPAEVNIFLALIRKRGIHFAPSIPVNLITVDPPDNTVFGFRFSVFG